MVVQFITKDKAIVRQFSDSEDRAIRQSKIVQWSDDLKRMFRMEEKTELRFMSNDTYKKIYKKKDHQLPPIFDVTNESTITLASIL